jgi:hypothetical protein
MAGEPRTEFGLNPDTTRLEVLTEFLDPLVPKGKKRVLRGETDPDKRRGMVSPDLLDTVLEAGSMVTGPGRAFVVPVKEPVADRSAEPPIGKNYQTIDERHILFEAIEYHDLAQLLKDLQARVGGDSGHIQPKRALASRRAGQVSRERLLPLPPVSEGAEARAIRVADASEGDRPGVLLDYYFVSSGSNFTFVRDTTYYATGVSYLSGWTKIEGGAVIKYDQDASVVLLDGFPTCYTGLYLPAVFTSKDNNTIGEPIAGSTGTPTGRYADYALYIVATSAGEAGGFRIDSADYGIVVSGGQGHHLRNLQMRNCASPVTYANGPNYGVTVGNALIKDCDYVVGGQAWPGWMENVTFRNVAYLSNWELKNCLVVCVTNYGLAHQSTFFGSADTGLFATNNAGHHYLALGSPHRNAGTTNISARTRADIRERTTYPPGAQGTLAQRDTDLPDLGYHYDPVDLAASGDGHLLNSTVPGMVLATYGGTYFNLMGGTHQGTPINPIISTRLDTVQELPFSGWVGTNTWTGIGFFPLLGSGWHLRFWRFYSPFSPGGRHINGSTGGSGGLRDCEFRGGRILISSFNLTNLVSLSLGVTNCLFERVAVALTNGLAGFNADFRNNLFISDIYAGPGIQISAAPGSTWTLTDNVILCPLQSTVALNHNYNAHTTTYYPTPYGPNDIIVNSNPSATAGALGSYYNSDSRLLNAGSRLATDAGLCHYTTTTDQAKDGWSTVDLGYHYVSLNGPTDRVIAKTRLAVDASAGSAFVEEAINGLITDTGWISATGYSRWLRVQLPGRCWIRGFAYRPNSTPLTDFWLEALDRLLPGSSSVLVANGTWSWPNGEENRIVYFTPVMATEITLSSYTSDPFVNPGAREIWVLGLSGEAVSSDSDWDGMPDYLEDLNGNGVVDFGETDVYQAADFGFKVQITRPSGTSPLP